MYNNISQKDSGQICMCNCSHKRYKLICFVGRYYIYIYLNKCCCTRPSVRLCESCKYSTAQTGANVFSILHPHFEARTINPPQSLVHAFSNLCTW